MKTPLLALTALIALLAATPLAAQPSGTVTVSTTAELTNAVFALNNFDGPRTILLRDGVYTIEGDNYIYLVQPGVTFRGLSGNRNAVVIQGDSVFHADGSRTGGTVGNVIGVAADNFTLENLSIGNCANHAVQLQLDIDNCVFRNVRFFNTGEQMLKAPSNGAADHSDNALVEDCLFEYPAGIGPQWYIGGVDAHRARNWIVRRCTFRNIRSPSGDVAEHAIHFWDSCVDITVEQNLIVDCDRGIGFGLNTSPTTGGVIRNNMIYHRSIAGFADVGIGLESAANVQVYNNTIFLQSGYPHAIEYRFASTTAQITNNLTNALIRQRDGATGTLGNNVTNAQSAWFVAPASGNLRLASRVAAVVDQGRTIAGLIADFDGELRPQGAGMDIGADEFTENLPATYATWRTANFGADAGNDAIAGPLADPDGAGLSNYARYAFNLPPRGAVSSPVILDTVGDGAARVLRLTFPRRTTATDLSYIVEASTDLATWAPVPGLTYSPGAGPVTAQDSVALGAAPRRFLRVRVAAVP
ncbi:MAG: right-handed parallel beta-helix repeat-containing protein [Opitutaceae bacterium]|nr:right-handed parallel beta-helix repeat-containing protein [Opitutaceae bacterium]